MLFKVSVFSAKNAKKSRVFCEILTPLMYYNIWCLYKNDFVSSFKIGFFYYLQSRALRLWSSMPLLTTLQHLDVNNINHPSIAIS